jgi:hypothetical protein
MGFFLEYIDSLSSKDCTNSSKWADSYLIISLSISTTGSGISICY